ncbi:MAG: response regulator [Gammaproteobacteria bacterium]|nr:MAG: response regulator [Gammaproteobacteria bacterium]
MRLLLVEDDPLLGEGLQASLQLEGYAVDWLQDGEAAWAALRSDTFDMIVLDLGLPRLSGLEVLKRLRTHNAEVPVLILTARDAPRDRVEGLDSGADDYLIKPFDLDELAARLRALARRRSGHRRPVMRHGPIELDPSRHEVRFQGQPVVLPRREFSLLRLLLEHAGEVVPRHRLQEALYGWQDDVESNTLEVYIHHLRRKLGREWIVTVRGVGYRIPEVVE